MNKELEIWHFAAGRLKRNDSVMLLVVAESSGSSPGRQGFKMIVAHDELCGSVGGGVMEVTLVEKARFQISNFKFQIPDSKIVEQVHRKNSPDASGMICSGEQKVILFALNSEHLETVREIIIALENNKSCRLQISNFKFQISENRSDEIDFKFEQKKEPRRLETVCDRRASDSLEQRGHRPLLNNDFSFIYEENLGCKNKLFIIGGGHCALALSELMAKMDFHISLFDDRADLNTLAKNEFVHEKRIIDSYQNIGDFIESGANNYVVVMTLGYKFDEIVIRQLFDKKFKYFGVLGSRAKMKTLLKSLEKEGFDKNKLAKIYTPIGVQINSRTPEEIAVSIAAEIISIKNS
jgi:xanthine dehydrogenase accessory factor